MCRHCVTLICSQMLGEYLLYFSCVVTVIEFYVGVMLSDFLLFCPYLVIMIQLYVAQCFVSVYYIVRVSSL